MFACLYANLCQNLYELTVIFKQYYGETSQNFYETNINYQNPFMPNYVTVIEKIKLNFERCYSKLRQRHHEINIDFGTISLEIQ